jgi:hypothetical protein
MSRSRHCWVGWLLLAAGLPWLAGCVNSRADHSRNTAVALAAGQSIVLLPASYHKGNATEDGFLDCVSEHLRDGKPPVDVMAGSRFRDALYPWFEPRTVPQTADALPELMKKPGVGEQLRQTGVRYLVWVSGATERSNEGGALSCAASTVGGGCFGLLWWETIGDYEAAVWDLERAVTAGDVSSDARGTSIVPALIVPLPFIARTQTAACKNLAQELRALLLPGEDDS